MRRVRALVFGSSLLSLIVAVGALGAQPPAIAPPAAGTPPIEGIAEKMGRRVISELRQVHHAMPRAVASAHVTQPDGGEEVFVLYELGTYDACVGSAPTKQQGREQCRGMLSRDQTCTSRGIAHVTIGPTPRGRPEGTGGALTVVNRVDVPGRCSVERVLKFEHRDIDGNERRELVIDLVTEEVEREYRSGEPVSSFGRHLLILREDLSAQASLAIGSWGVTSYEMAVECRAGRWSLADQDGDGKADLRYESFSYEDSGGCRPGDDGWFAPEPDEAECGGSLQTEIWRYDPAADTFVDPSP